MFHSLRKSISAIVTLSVLTISPWAINLSRAGDLPAIDNHNAVQATPQQGAVSNKPANGKRPLNRRVLFITAKDSPHSDQELARLRQPHGEFAKMKAAGWTIGIGPENMVQIVDRDEVPDLVEKLSVQEFPTVACIDHDEVVRYFRWGCTTPLDAWTFGFLAKGIDERPPGAVLEAARVESTGSYPLRGNHWSVEGDWSPTRDKVITHLRGPNHLAELIPAWHIDDWSLEELRSLHDDLHEKYDTGSYSSTRSSNSSSPASDYLRFKGGRS